MATQQVKVKVEKCNIVFLNVAYRKTNNNVYDLIWLNLVNILKIFII